MRLIFFCTNQKTIDVKNTKKNPMSNSVSVNGGENSGNVDGEKFQISDEIQKEKVPIYELGG